MNGAWWSVLGLPPVYFRFTYKWCMVVSVGIAASIFLLMYNMQHGGQCRSYHQFISVVSMYAARWPVSQLPTVYIRCKYVCSTVASVVVITSLYPLQVFTQHGGQCWGYFHCVSAVTMYAARSVLGLPPVYIRCNYV